MLKVNLHTLGVKPWDLAVGFLQVLMCIASVKLTKFQPASASFHFFLRITVAIADPIKILHAVVCVCI